MAPDTLSALSRTFWLLRSRPSPSGSRRWARFQRLRDEAGVAAVVAHRTDPPGQGGVHVLQEHPTGRSPQAGGEEAAELPRRRGELPEDGLAAFGDDGDDMMMALARKIVSGDEEEADDEAMEEVFA